MAAQVLTVQRHNATVLAELKPGDLIEFPRGLYSHWAVYIGDEEVVHLAGDDNDGINGQFDSGHLFTICGQRFKKALVKVENFWNVVEGCKAKKSNKDTKHTPLPKTKILQNALGHLGSIGYNVMFENCEHFATWCRYGLSKSEQVDNFLTFMALGATAVATAGIMYGLSRSKNKKHTEEEL